MQRPRQSIQNVGKRVVPRDASDRVGSAPRTFLRLPSPLTKGGPRGVSFQRRIAPAPHASPRKPSLLFLKSQISNPLASFRPAPRATSASAWYFARNAVHRCSPPLFAAQSVYVSLDYFDVIRVAGVPQLSFQ